MGELSRPSARRWRERPILAWAWDNHLDMVSGLGFFALIAAAIVALVVVVCTISITTESRNCAYASRQYHRATHYDWLAGCYVELGDGRRIALDKYRVFAEDRHG